MKRKFYLMVEGIEEEYAYKFFKRFGEDLQKEKGVITKLRNYEGVCGNYIITLDLRNLKSNRTKLIKTNEFPKEMEKCIVGVYLPDTLLEFLQLCGRKSTLIEAGEGRDAVTGKIIITERKGEKKHYLKGPLLHSMKGASVEEVPLEKVLKY